MEEFVVTCFTFRQVDSDIQKRVLNCCDYIHDQGMSKDEKVLIIVTYRRIQYSHCFQLLNKIMNEVKFLNGALWCWQYEFHDIIKSNNPKAERCSPFLGRFSN